MRNLNVTASSKIFYEDRYMGDYMDDWPDDKKSRIYNIIKNLDLPKEGVGLDFGCGNGVFTKVLKQALPNWKIYGCDLSEIAIEKAKSRIPNCIFFSNKNGIAADEKFDFIFTHHVLEHVFDIESVVKQMLEKLNNNSRMLHILPCWDAGSFESKLYNLRNDFIDMESRLPFEDEGHVRRMTTESCSLLFKKYGFILMHSFYSNQYYGAINWITRENSSLILKMFNPSIGKNMKAKFKLSFLLIKFMAIYTLRWPVPFCKKANNPILLKILFNIPCYISIYVDRSIVRKAEQEWKDLKEKQSGSEMYLYFIKERCN